jgi:hypothetical protein
MAYDPKRGDALLIPSGPSGDPDRKHLHCIITDRCGAEMHLLVCVESVGPGYHDPSCLLEIGEHDFITKQSWVNYRHTRCHKAARLTKLVDGWVASKRTPLTQHLLGRVCDGLMASRMTPRGMKRYFQALHPNP